MNVNSAFAKWRTASRVVKVVEGQSRTSPPRYVALPHRQDNNSVSSHDNTTDPPQTQQLPTTMRRTTTTLIIATRVDTSQQANTAITPLTVVESDCLSRVRLPSFCIQRNKWTIMPTATKKRTFRRSSTVAAVIEKVLRRCMKDTDRLGKSCIK